MRSLVAAGKSDVVMTTRNAYRQAMKADLISAVERCSDRQVAAFLSESHIEPDIAIESFVLEPRAGESASAADLNGTPGADSNGHVESGSA